MWIDLYYPSGDHPSIYTMHLSAYLPINLSTYQSIFLSFYLSIYLSIYLILSNSISFYLSIYQSINQSNLPTYLSTELTSPPKSNAGHLPAPIQAKSMDEARRWSVIFGKNSIRGHYIEGYPQNTQKWWLLMGKPMGLLGKPTILGNP